MKSRPLPALSFLVFGKGPPPLRGRPDPKKPNENFTTSYSVWRRHLVAPVVGFVAREKKPDICAPILSRAFALE
jgi:hypothetical protein